MITILSLSARQRRTREPVHNKVLKMNAYSNVWDLNIYFITRSPSDDGGETVTRLSGRKRSG